MSPPKKEVASVSDANKQSDPEVVSSPVSASSVRRMVTEEWNDESGTEITGPPSRNHWKVSNATDLRDDRYLSSLCVYTVLDFTTSSSMMCL
jgi:hypothetical protein